MEQVCKYGFVVAVDRSHLGVAGVLGPMSTLNMNLVSAVLTIRPVEEVAFCMKKWEAVWGAFCTDCVATYAMRDMNSIQFWWNFPKLKDTSFFPCMLCVTPWNLSSSILSCKACYIPSVCIDQAKKQAVHGSGLGIWIPLNPRYEMGWAKCSLVTMQQCTMLVPMTHDTGAAGTRSAVAATHRRVAGAKDVWY